jgi:hypothetical protein
MIILLKGVYINSWLMEQAEVGTLWMIISIAGFVITMLLGVIAFFISRIINDVKCVLEETGKNKGRIELVEQQQINDVKRIEQMTQMELKVMSEKVGNLADNVNMLVFGKSGMSH